MIMNENCETFVRLNVLMEILGLIFGYCYLCFCFYDVC